MLTLDLQTARRFILGKQGLWPGRRWRGLAGAEQAMREIAYLQLDPLQIIARSHDIQLNSRVIDYKPGMWETLTYEERKFFDWGGWLATRPMEELPYWRRVMRRELEGHPDCDPRTRKNGEKYAQTIEEMRAVLKEQEVVNNRAFEMAGRQRVESYRGRKDSAVALYHLWRTGEIMTHHREKFERVYARTEHVAPAHLIKEMDDGAVDQFLFKKEVAFAGLSRFQRTQDAYYRGVPFSQRDALTTQLLDQGDIVEVKVEGWRQTHYALSEDMTLLETLMSDDIPTEWTPAETTTQEEVSFLAPLDPVSARGRSKLLFGVEYVWEVYKPVEKRKHGYYTLPILWGDRFVARFDSQFDKESKRFSILGFWLEDQSLAQNEQFASALALGYARFLTFLGATAINADRVEFKLLNEAIQNINQDA